MIIGPHTICSWLIVKKQINSNIYSKISFVVWDTGILFLKLLDYSWLYMGVLSFIPVVYNRPI